MRYTHDTQVLVTDVDLCGRCSPYSVFSAMQELATMHAAKLGLGREELLAKGLVWIVARARLEMGRYPAASERLAASTYYGAPSRIGFHRYYSIETKAGELLGRASNLWLLVDVETRRITSPLKAGMVFPDEDIQPELRLETNKLSFEGDITSTTSRIPVYSDYDVNGHVNNARYVQWVCDALPLESMRENMISTLELNYIAEIREGEAVDIELAQNGSSFSMRGLVGGDARFLASGTLRRL